MARCVCLSACLTVSPVCLSVASECLKALAVCVCARRVAREHWGEEAQNLRYQRAQSAYLFHVRCTFHSPAARSFVSVSVCLLRPSCASSHYSSCSCSFGFLSVCLSVLPTRLCDRPHILLPPCCLPQTAALCYTCRSLFARVCMCVCICAVVSNKNVQHLENVCESSSSSPPWAAVNFHMTHTPHGPALTSSSAIVKPDNTPNWQPFAHHIHMYSVCVCVYVYGVYICVF